MRRTVAIAFALTGWFAVIMQYVLMLKNSEVAATETTIRFFSYFTILTNLLTAIVLTCESFRKTQDSDSGFLTAIVVYITIVGMVYQISLRPLWSPQGMQKLVDELLHSVIPVFVILYWVLYGNKQRLQYKQLVGWLLFPLIYLAFVLTRGRFSGFYPYPFINVKELGIGKVLANAVGLTLGFVLVSVLFIAIGKRIYQKPAG